MNPAPICRAEPTNGMRLASPKRFALQMRGRLSKLGRGERLRLTKQVLAIRRHGSWARGTLLSCGILPNALHYNRLGLRIQRGQKGAVSRNRAKRIFRAAYRQHKDELLAGHDMLVVLHRIEAVSLKRLEEDFLSACRRLRLLA